MTGMGPRLTGLICEDDVAVSRAIVDVMSVCGFKSIRVVQTGREAVVSAARTRPELAVIDLALAGARGLGLVGDLRRAVPECNVVVVSPFPALRSKALAVGAFAVCQPHDLRQLQLSLEHVLEHPAGSSDGCDCQQVAALGPSATLKTGSPRRTTTAASWAARYRPLPETDALRN